MGYKVIRFPWEEKRNKGPGVRLEEELNVGVGQGFRLDKLGWLADTGKVGSPPMECVAVMWRDGDIDFGPKGGGKDGG